MSKWERTERNGIVLFSKTWTRWDRLLWKLHIRRTWKFRL